MQRLYLDFHDLQNIRVNNLFFQKIALVSKQVLFEFSVPFDLQIVVLVFCVQVS